MFNRESVIIIKEPATLEQIEQMLETLRVYIKVVVDIERSILAGGGEKHAWCEAILLEDGSRQSDIWSANWIPFNQSMDYESNDMLWFNSSFVRPR
jgi:hypothetical protein